MSSLSPLAGNLVLTLHQAARIVPRRHMAHPNVARHTAKHNRIDAGNKLVVAVRFAALRQKVELAVRPRNEAVDAGANKNRCRHRELLASRRLTIDSNALSRTNTLTRPSSLNPYTAIIPTSCRSIRMIYKVYIDKQLLLYYSALCISHSVLARYFVSLTCPLLACPLIPPSPILRTSSKLRIL